MHHLYSQLVYVKQATIFHGDVVGIDNVADAISTDHIHVCADLKLSVLGVLKLATDQTSQKAVITASGIPIT